MVGQHHATLSREQHFDGCPHSRRPKASFGNEESLSRIDYTPISYKITENVEKNKSKKEWKKGRKNNSNNNNNNNQKTIKKQTQKQ